VAEIAVPNGRLAVCDPFYLPRGTEGDPLVIEVPPGVYPVQEAGGSFEGEYCGERFTARDTFAVRLLVSQESAVSWTMAVPPGDDARILRDGECFGFAVDSATGCFVDPAARTELGRRYKRFVTSRDGDDDGVQFVEGGYVRAADVATGAELLAFGLDGDGVFPVWVGRDEAGAVTAVMVTGGYTVSELEPLRS
jgi:hypothetical protein